MASAARTPSPRCYSRCSAAAPRVSCRVRETAHGFALVVENLEHSGELGDLQQVVHAFGELQKFQRAAFAARRGVRRYQFGDAGAVNILDARQIQEDLLASFLT